MDNLIGKRLDGRYSIESLVGVGGMANVYRGTDFATGNQIAVKVLKDEFLDNEELVRRFKNESKAISILSHPNIVKVYDVSVTDNCITSSWNMLTALPKGIPEATRRCPHLEGDRALCHADAQRVGARPLQGHYSPRRQATEHYAAGRWLHQDDGLRHCTLLPRTEPDRQRQGHRLGSLHQPGAGQGRPYRRPHRYLFCRRYDVRDAVRPPAV